MIAGCKTPTPKDVLLARIASKVVRTPEGCLEFQGARSAGQYAYLKVDKKVVAVHRLVVQLLRGPIPPGMVVDHRVCSNPPCCNLQHLIACTPAENIARGNSPSAIARRLGRCAKGHPLPSGRCRICDRARRAARRSRIGAAA